MPISTLRCNEQIRLTPIRLIDHEGTQRGVVPTAEALQLARENGLDLVEVSPTERPPVCKIMDYGKHKYTLSKKHKQKHHEQKMKEVRIRPKTDVHDREIKMNQAKRFLQHGDRVQFTMMFRGRERFHQDIGMEAFDEIVKELVELAKVESPAKMFGKRMTMVLIPLKLPAAHSHPQPAPPPKPKAKPKAPTDATKVEAAPGAAAAPSSTGSGPATVSPA